MIPLIVTIVLIAIASYLIVPTSDKCANFLAISMSRIANKLHSLIPKNLRPKASVAVRSLVGGLDQFKAYLAEKKYKVVIHHPTTWTCLEEIGRHDDVSNSEAKFVVLWELTPDEWNTMCEVIANKVSYEFPDEIADINFDALNMFNDKLNIDNISENDVVEIPREIVIRVDSIIRQLPQHPDTGINFDELKAYTRELGIKVSFEELPIRVRSMLFYFNGKGFIVINSIRSETSKWYLLAYELGHHLLHEHRQLNLPIPTDMSDLYNRHRAAEADYFAQSIFLPRTLLHQYCQDCDFKWDEINEKMLSYCVKHVNPTQGFSGGTKTLIKRKMGNRLHYEIKYYFPGIWKTNKPPLTPYQ